MKKLAPDDANADIKPVITALFLALHGQRATVVTHASPKGGGFMAFVRGPRHGSATVINCHQDLTIRAAYLNLAQKLQELIEKKVASFPRD